MSEYQDQPHAPGGAGGNWLDLLRYQVFIDDPALTGDVYNPSTRATETKS
jgi:hypothetical protein